MPWPNGPVDTRTKLDDLAPPDDSTRLDASTKRHGLMPKLTGDPSQFLGGDGRFANPLGGSLAVVDATFSIQDDVTPSKIAKFQCASISAATTRTFTFPDSNGTLALIDFAQTWTALQTFRENTFRVVDSGDATKIVFFDTGDMATGAQVSLAFSNTGSVAYDFPPTSANLAALNITQNWIGLQNYFDAFWLMKDSADATKVMAFECGSITTGTTRTLTVPDASGTIALTTSIDVARAWTTLQKFPDDKLQIVGSADAAKVIRFETDGATTAKTLTLASAHTLDRTVTFPNVTGTLPTLENAHTITGGWTADGTTNPFTVSTSPIGAYDGTGFLLKDSVSGFSAQLNLNAAVGLSANRIMSFPDADIIVVGTTSVQSLTNKTLNIGTGNLLKTSTAASGVAFSDTTTASKQLRVILSGAASANHAIAIVTTATRTWTMPDVSGTVLTTANGVGLLGTATIDMKTAAANTVYTTPAGVVTRITHAVVRDATASLAGGTSYTITGLRAAFSLAALTTVNTGFIEVRSADLAEQIEVAASTAVQLTVTTGSTAAANATVDIFGYAL